MQYIFFEVQALPSQQHTWRAAAVVLSDQLGVVEGVYGVAVAQLDHLLESVVDEDEADQGGEALLGEAREVLHQEAGVGGDQQQAEQARPEADPQPELQVVEAVVPEEGEGAHGKWFTETQGCTLGLFYNLWLISCVLCVLCQVGVENTHIPEQRAGWTARGNIRGRRGRNTLRLV